MSSTQKDQLFSLIKSLTKAEKRNFKLYAKRFQSGADSKFLQLFDVLDKLPDYDEDLLLKKLPDVKKRHLGNQKRHLYKQLLISLRLIYINKNIDIQIREQVDFARILYSKGMYMQALKLLDRIKQIAVDHHQDILHLEILEFEKLIEARHITRSRSVENKMENLLDEAARRSYVTYTTSLLSNLNIQVQGWYIQHGHARNEDDLTEVKAFYESIYPDQLDLKKLTFFEKVNLAQSEMWYHYIRLDFPACRREAEKWVNLFDTFPQMQEKDPDLYIRGLYYLLTFLFFLKEKEKYRETLRKMKRFIQAQDNSNNVNSQMVSFVYLSLSRLNRHFLFGTFRQGLKIVPELLKGIDSFKHLTDTHRILLLYYKIAYLYFGCGDYGNALEYLNKITAFSTGFLREDLHLNARLLHLICHYELKNHDLLDYLIPSVQRAFDKASEISEWQTSTIRFLREINRMPQPEVKNAFSRFKQKMVGLSGNPYEKKEILYLDIPSWIEGHLQNCSIQELFAKQGVTG